MKFLIKLIFVFLYYQTVSYVGKSIVDRDAVELYFTLAGVFGLGLTFIIDSLFEK